ncbi:phage recombination protein Bet [Actinobaculum suis]|uniref:phage recombination protein Bet n=1 Tax=Actinobaculum suis TaxID=1657 RepID=UPI00066FD950|nr:phage recombination protein Bet [Actinobaculum suis]
MSETAGSVVEIREDQTEFNTAQITALNLQGASRADLAIFFHQVRRTGLDPFARQIYMIPRSTWNAQTRQREMKYTIQTGIDGFRVIARRAASQAGGTYSYSATEYCGPNGQWRDVWLDKEPPLAARVTVYRDGQPFPAVALLSEYAGRTGDGRLTTMWRTKPAIMLGKCAEALALRKAFPQDLSGLYTDDEMTQADNPAVQDHQTAQQVQPTVQVENPPAAPTAPNSGAAPRQTPSGEEYEDAEIMLTATQVETLEAQVEALRLSPGKMTAAVQWASRNRTRRLEELTEDEADRLIGFLHTKVEEINQQAQQAQAQAGEGNA